LSTTAFVPIFERGAVAHGHVVADHRLTVLADVHDRVVLNVGAGADADRPVIAPQHHAEPDTRLLADFHVAD
jgi:hypothetical protein